MRFFFCLAAALAAISLSSLLAAADFSLGLDAPFTEHSTTRERQCLNGLWRFRPLSPDEKLSDAPPAAGTGWGYFKVPGVWPQGGGRTNSFQPLLPPEMMKLRLRTFLLYVVL